MMTLEPMTITRKAGIATGTDDDAAGTDPQVGRR